MHPQIDAGSRTEPPVSEPIELFEKLVFNQLRFKFNLQISNP